MYSWSGEDRFAKLGTRVGRERNSCSLSRGGGLETISKDHGAKRQKKLAKHKAKREERRSELARRESKDPTVRLKDAEKWPIVDTLLSDQIWTDGIGDAVIVRRMPDGNLAVAVFLLDVYCLGVKNAFWRILSKQGVREMLETMDATETMRSVRVAKLVKLIHGSKAYAHSLGFAPHPDYRHASMLLAGIDPASCTEEFTFGYRGRPFYIQGPNDSYERVKAISQRVVELGGDYLMGLDFDEGLAASELEDDEHELGDEVNDEDLPMSDPDGHILPMVRPSPDKNMKDQ